MQHDITLELGEGTVRSQANGGERPYDLKLRGNVAARSGLCGSSRGGVFACAKRGEARGIDLAQSGLGRHGADGCHGWRVADCYLAAHHRLVAQGGFLELKRLFTVVLVLAIPATGSCAAERWIGT